MTSAAATYNFNFSTLSLLVADSMPFMRGIVTEMCRSFGFRIVHDANDGREAYELLRQTKVDLVVCDYAMEPMDGVEFTRMVRTGEGSSDRFVPIVMLTSHTHLDIITAARDAGVTEMLAKPISTSDMLNRLIYVVDRPRPFVRNADYFGPDRRRHVSDSYAGPERREADQSAELAATGGTQASRPAPGTGEPRVEAA